MLEHHARTMGCRCGTGTYVRIECVFDNFIARFI